MLNRERVIQNFIRLVAQPCASLHESKVSALIFSQLEEMGYHPQWDHVEEKTGGDCGNIIVTLPATKGYEDKDGIFFESHMDSVNPCTGTKVVRRDGVLYSDGTTVLGGDDKAGVAAMLEVLQSLSEDNIPHALVQMLFTVSEEIGCLGARNIDRSLIRAKYGYCLDGGGSLGNIVYRAPEQNVYKVVIIGKAAHAGVEPEKGISAIMLAAFALSALPAYGRIDDETTLNVGLINGGRAANIVAPECEFIIDVRSLDKKKLAKLSSQIILAVTQKATDLGGQVEFSLVDSCPAADLPKDSPCVVLAGQSALNLGAGTFNLLSSGGCSDGNYFCGMGLPAVCLGTGMSNIHSTEEYLSEEDLFNTARWVQEIIRLTAQE